MLKAAYQIGIGVIKLKTLPALKLKYLFIGLHRPNRMVVGNNVTVFGRGLNEHVYVLCGILAGLLRTDTVELFVIVLEILAVDSVVADVLVIILVAREKIKVNLGQIAVALCLLVGADICFVAGEKEKFIIGQIVVRMGRAMVGDSKHLISRIFISFLKLLGSQSAVRDRAVAMKICLELFFIL